MVDTDPPKAAEVSSASFVLSVSELLFVAFFFMASGIGIDDYDYLVDSIWYYQFGRSTFDVVLATALHTGVMWYCYSYVHDYAAMTFSIPERFLFILQKEEDARTGRRKRRRQTKFMRHSGGDLRGANRRLSLRRSKSVCDGQEAEMDPVAGTSLVRGKSCTYSREDNIQRDVVIETDAATVKYLRVQKLALVSSVLCVAFVVFKWYTLEQLFGVKFNIDFGNPINVYLTLIFAAAFPIVHLCCWKLFCKRYVALAVTEYYNAMSAADNNIRRERFAPTPRPTIDISDSQDSPLVSATMPLNPQRQQQSHQDGSVNIVTTAQTYGSVQWHTQLDETESIVEEPMWVKFPKDQEFLEPDSSDDEFELGEDLDIMIEKKAFGGDEVGFPGDLVKDALDIDAKRRRRASTFMKLLKMAWPEKKYLFPGMIALVISSISSLISPRYCGHMLDAISGEKKDYDEFLNAILVLVFIYTIGSIASFFRSWLFTMSGYRYVTRLREKLHGSIITQEIGFFDTTPTGDLVSRLTSDCQALQNAVSVNISMLVRYTVQIVGSLAVMFSISWKLTCVMLVVVPVVAVGAVIYGKYVKGVRSKFQNELASASTLASEFFGNIRTVRAFSNDARAHRYFCGAIERTYKTGKRLSMASGIFAGCVEGLSQYAIVFVLWYGGTLVVANEISVGVLASFMLYTFSLAMSFAFLSSLYGDFMSALGAAVHILHLLERVPCISHGGSGLKVEGLKGEVKFQNVKFAYPSRPEAQVLNGLSFEIPKYQVTAIIGPSGGGKSTVVSLLARFYDPQEGCILLDDRNLKDYDPLKYRKRIGFVTQEPVLFSGTVKDNIKYSKSTAKMEDIITVAKMANAHEFISSFPEGYNTLVGERGVGLSGGQKQRIAIARALLHDPDILVFDEATSALDGENERQVQVAIEQASADRTVIIIAHRLSTIRNADNILVVDGGKVVEQGNHKELMECAGSYSNLYQSQK
eukprot:Nk52_evm24s158 gene=Nk52_evmTU24s158